MLPFNVGDRVILSRGFGGYMSLQGQQGIVDKCWKGIDGLFVNVLFDSGISRAAYVSRFDLVEDVSNVPEDWS